MVLALTFGLVLLVTVALSGLAARSVLSTALVFLVAGALVGPGVLGFIEVAADGPVVRVLADLALFTVLFVDGGRISLRALRTGWRLSGRALGLGMPLALGLVAVATHFLVGLDWPTSLLVGAILAPTDPVFASTIVSRDEVPMRLRRLLNVESGLNDGLALPFVLIFLAMTKGEDTALPTIGFELLAGIALGIVLPVVVAALFRIPLLGAEPKLQPLGPLALAVILYAVCHLTHANPYLAAFSAGMTLATVAPRAAHEFEKFGELVSELTKFAAVMVFGALLQAGTPQAQTVFELVALTIAVSIIAHSMSDVPVARAFDVETLAGLPEKAPKGGDDPDAEPRGATRDSRPHGPTPP